MPYDDRDLSLLGNESGHEVEVTVAPAKPMMTRAEWHKFVAETAGSWKGDLERPEQGELEEREPFS